MNNSKNLNEYVMIGVLLGILTFVAFLTFDVPDDTQVEVYETVYVFEDGLTPVSYMYNESGASIWLCENKSEEYIICIPDVIQRSKEDE